MSLPTNGPSQLLQFDNNGQLPVDLTLAAGTVYTGDGSGLTDLPGGNIDPGTVGIGAINASGTPSHDTFLRGDGTWAGAVTSVGLTAPPVFTVSGSPVTDAGTLALGFADGQPANQFLATPNGSTGPLGLRAIAAADLPAAVTVQGNTFNGVSQLVETDGTGKLPVLSAANLTNLPGGNIIPGTVGIAALNATGTPSATTYLRGDGTWATPPAAVISNGVQVFTSSGTFTVPAGVTVLDVELVGGGGATGGTSDTGSFGGGGGGYSRKRLSGLTPGSLITVTVGGGGSGGPGAGGDGGTSSFGSYFHATGGTGGNYTNNSAGGVGVSGDINMPGGVGAGDGGASILGVGSAGGNAGGAAYGGGASSNPPGEGDGAGGGNGVVIVRW